MKRYLPIFIGIEILACIICIVDQQYLGALGWGAYVISNIADLLKKIQENNVKDE